MSAGKTMKCPICGGRPARIYKCTVCGEVRCGQDKCIGSLSTYRGWASAGTQCRACGKGRYASMDFVGREMDEFLRDYKPNKRIEVENP
ncbi:MAG: hypothetical protein HQL54_01845 [Magnetococcales bacterium]|nr:hypothetical protein [Magnetococcales bacterium]